MYVGEYFKHNVNIFGKFLRHCGQSANNYRNVSLPYEQTVQTVPQRVPVFAIVFGQAERYFQNTVHFPQIFTPREIKQNRILSNRLEGIAFLFLIKVHNKSPYKFALGGGRPVAPARFGFGGGTAEGYLPRPCFPFAGAGFRPRRGGADVAAGLFRRAAACAVGLIRQSGP